MSNFKNVFRFLRKSRKLTQTQLANDLGVKISTISMYECGNRHPNFEIAEAIADYFNVSMDFLHGRTLNPSRVDGSHDINLNMDNFKEINDLIAEVRDLPPEKIKAILQLVKTLK